MNIKAYRNLLSCSPSSSSICCQASLVLQVGHDQINRFLLKGNYTSKDLYEKTKAHLFLRAGTLTIDDSVLDKPYRKHRTDYLCIQANAIRLSEVSD